MESELERFHKQNTQLELNITELRQKLKATEKEMHGERQRVRDVEAVVRRFKTDLHNCVGYIQDPKLLKESIRALYQKHVQEDIVSLFPCLCNYPLYFQCFSKFSQKVLNI